MMDFSSESLLLSWTDSYMVYDKINSNVQYAVLLSYVPDKKQFTTQHKTLKLLMIRR